MYGRPMLLVFAWFIIDVHKWFKGPRVDVEYNILGDGDDGFRGTPQRFSVESDVKVLKGDPPA